MAQDVDARTDVFAVGIILWELLTGQRLFLGDTDFQTVKKVQASVVPSVSEINKGVSPELDRIVMRCLEKDPADRPQSAAEISHQLDAVTTGETTGSLAAIAFCSRALSSAVWREIG